MMGRRFPERWVDLAIVQSELADGSFCFQVKVNLRKPGAKLEHQGIKIELIGQIELYYDRGNHYEFLSMAKELARPGDLIHSTDYPFEFPHVEKPYEIYIGANVRLRYFLRITVIRRISDIIRQGNSLSRSRIRLCTAVVSL